LNTATRNNKPNIRYSTTLRPCSQNFGGYHLYIRIQYLQLVTEIKSDVHLSYKSEIDPDNKLPRDHQKRSQVLELIDELKSLGSELYRNGLLNHPAQISHAFQGKTVTGLHFLATFEVFMTQQIAAVKTGDLSQGSLKNYFTTQRYLKKFVAEEFNRKDIPMTMFNAQFLDLFLAWLVDNTQSTNNGRQKHFERLKRFVTIQLKYDVLVKSPFHGFTIKTTVNPRTYLEEIEVQQIRNIALPSENLIISRDLFLFMCNTGLAYSDLFGLRANNISQKIDGKQIVGFRQKTKVEFLIPLFEEAENILTKYLDHPFAKKKNLLLPVFTNQVFNRHLKDISSLCGINKDLTTHVARHTFATTALTSGVPLETIQKVLGHADQRMTLHYARIVNSKINKDMEAFKEHMKKQMQKPNPSAPANQFLRVV
jgi:site-specific recombinase XerD